MGYVKGQLHWIELYTWPIPLPIVTIQFFEQNKNLNKKYVHINILIGIGANFSCDHIYLSPYTNIPKIFVSSSNLLKFNS